MNALIETAQAVQRLLDGNSIDFCFIGGFAAQRHAEPRVTRDVDVSVLTGLGNEAHRIDLLLRHFAPRIPGARAFAERNRVLLLLSEGGVPIDCTLTALDFEADVIARATLFDYLPGIGLKTCSAEDLVVLKVFAGRPIDWRDVEMVLRRYRDALDYAAIERDLAPLLAAKGEPDLAIEYARLKRRVLDRLDKG